MKILSIDDMLEAAKACELPDYKKHVGALEKAATGLAKSLARHLGINLRHEATWEGKDLEGICATFSARTPNQQCPAVIDAGDRSGDWEFVVNQSITKPNVES